MTNGTPQFPALQFGVAAPPDRPGIIVLTFAHAQVATQVSMTVGDADKMCAAWREVIDKAKSPIQIVTPGIVKPG